MIKFRRFPVTLGKFYLIILVKNYEVYDNQKIPDCLLIMIRASYRNPFLVCLRLNSDKDKIILSRTFVKIKYVLSKGVLPFSMLVRISHYCFDFCAVYICVKMY